MNITRLINAGLMATAVLLLAACASVPAPMADLEQARVDVANAQNEPLARQTAASELDDAQTALANADRIWQENNDPGLVRHYSYLATRNAEIVMERAAESRARTQIKAASAQRNELLLSTRDSQAQQLEREAALAKSRADRSEAETLRMAAELEALKAEKTERGMVLTLGDVLFDTNKAQLKAGAQTTVNRLAAFMTENSQRRILIEGHTDSRGSDEYNQALSARRADAVASALSVQGIDRTRISAQGLGERYPVASNDTAAGQQQNRRVEIVLSSPDGSFPAAARR